MVDQRFKLNDAERIELARYQSLGLFSSLVYWVECYAQQKSLKRISYDGQTSYEKSMALLKEIDGATTLEDKHQAIAKWVKVRNQDYYEVYC